MIEKIDLPKGKKHIELPSEKPHAIEKPIFVSDHLLIRCIFIWMLLLAAL
jgi:hypothetical protein